jgi:hypothetical protein
MGDVLVQLNDNAHALLIKLEGATPCHVEELDKRGWEDQGYFVNKGYDALLHQIMFLPKSKFWTNIWHLDGLLKINIFCWTLALRKVLIGETLCKRGFRGPTRCILCCSDCEIFSHLFLECDFSKDAWQVSLHELNHRVSWSIYVRHLLGIWKFHYQYSIHKPITKRLWLALPKFICWHI